MIKVVHVFQSIIRDNHSLLSGIGSNIWKRIRISSYISFWIRSACQTDEFQNEISHTSSIHYYLTCFCSCISPLHLLLSDIGTVKQSMGDRVGAIIFGTKMAAVPGDFARGRWRASPTSTGSRSRLSRLSRAAARASAFPSLTSDT